MPLQIGLLMQNYFSETTFIIQDEKFLLLFSLASPGNNQGRGGEGAELASCPLWLLLACKEST